MDFQEHEDAQQDPAKLRYYLVRCKTDIHLFLNWRLSRMRGIEPIAILSFEGLEVKTHPEGLNEDVRDQFRIQSWNRLYWRRAQKQSKDHTGDLKVKAQTQQNQQIWNSYRHLSSKADGFLE
ncbi:MAG: hypothetical protein ABH826_03480 [Patescibacteria group bacterium]